MPFAAQKPDTKAAVQPSDIGDSFHKKEDLECPFCGDPLRYREKATDSDENVIRRAHFWHYERAGSDGGDAGGCSKGGESPEHERWKMVTGELLAEKYEADEYFIEHPIGSKVADVAVHVDGEKKGVVAEYQHRNDSKNYLDTTKHYLKYGYGVHWIFNTNETHDLLFDAKRELEPYCDSVYLGEQALANDELINFGSLIWFDSFDWVVTNPKDFNPFFQSEEQGLYISGDFTSGGRARQVYETANPSGTTDEPSKLCISPVNNWQDVKSTPYADSGGAGHLDHFIDGLKNEEFELMGPVVDGASYSEKWSNLEIASEPP